MPRSDVQILIEKAERLAAVDGRFVDMAARLQVVHRNPDGSGQPIKGKLMPEIYGGRYDRILGRYVGRPEHVHIFTATEQQVEALHKALRGQHTETVLLGAPGSGKTYFLLLWAVLKSLMRPETTGGLCAPTNDRRLILWNDGVQLLSPLGWLDKDGVKATAKEIHLKNGVVWQVLATKAPSKEMGSPLQGRSWSWAGKDEMQSIAEDSHREIATRGRRAGTSYKIVGTATNQIYLASWRLYLERAKASPKHAIHRMAGKANVYVDEQYWEDLRHQMPENLYNALILGQDVTPERLVYNSFSIQDNVRQIPKDWKDITQKVTQEIYGQPYRYVVGQDFGVLWNASIVLKCLQDPKPQDGDPGKGRTWWAVDEVHTKMSTGEHHAHELLKSRLLSTVNKSDFIVVADPHHNSTDVDKSDYAMFVNAGITIRQARLGKISVTHRLNMMNTLFRDASGRRRLFIAADAHNRELCPMLTKALLTQEYTETGRHMGKKDLSDMSHWPDAVGYGVYPWEKIRAKASVQVAGRTGENIYGPGSPLNTLIEVK